VDRDLAKHDVRLTQGGEPTFISIDDMEAPMELRRCRRKAQAAETLLRRARARSLRADSCISDREVVSGRAVAALGARGVVADRRQAAVARPR
jgi:hypothetical protein